LIKTTSLKQSVSAAGDTPNAYGPKDRNKRYYQLIRCPTPFKTGPSHLERPKHLERLGYLGHYSEATKIPILFCAVCARCFEEPLWP
jgi:hypothetical protein